MILVVPRSHISRIPRIWGMSITMLWYVPILEHFGLLVVYKLIALKALIKINLVILFLARPVLPGLHSGHEEAFAEARVLFLH